MEKATRHETAEKTYSWKLTTFEKQGNLWLEWTTNAPFRAQQDLIKVYKNGFPRDPNASSAAWNYACLLYTSPSPRDAHESRMPSSA